VEIITWFLEAVQVLLLAKVAMLLVAGLGLALTGFLKRKRWLIALGLLIAFGQFAWPLIFNASYDNVIDARRDYVRNLPKAPIPADYPRRIVIIGDLTPKPPGWFIAAGYADEVDVEGQRFVAAQGIEQCREAALALADPEGKASRTSFEGNPYPRVKACATEAGLAKPDADAVIVRIGNKTTLFDRENARRHGAPRAIQVSVRRNSQEKLAHYDEMPILGSPSSATQLLPEQYDYPCPDFAYLQIVANLLDAARQPAQAARLMQRGSARHSQYDDCIASAPPTRGSKS
jgi:hypothetical protein